MTIGPEEQGLLDRLGAAMRLHRETKASSRARALKQADEENAQGRLEIALRVHELVRRGVPKAAIGRKLGTTDHKTIQGFLELAAGVVNAAKAAAPSDPDADKYSFDEETRKLVVTLSGADLERSLRVMDWKVTEAQAREMDLHRVEGLIVKNQVGGYAYRVSTPRWMTEHNNSHPAAWWVDENMAEVLAWFERRAA